MGDIKPGLADAFALPSPASPGQYFSAFFAEVLRRKFSEKYAYLLAKVSVAEAIDRERGPQLVRERCRVRPRSDLRR